MNRIIFISGLGANELAFSKIGDLKCKKIVAQWIPNRKNETVTDYVKRLIEKHKIISTDILAGLSFGGILAQEISQIQGNSLVILISSFKKRSDLKFPFKIALGLGLYRIPLIRIPILEEIVANLLNSGNRESNMS